MKKLIPILLAVFAFAFVSCEKDPDLDKLNNEYLVYTNYDKSANFTSFSTFYIADEILIVDGKDEQETSTSASSLEIIAAIKAQMEARGYTYDSDKSTADLGVQVSYVQSTYYFTDYGYPNWGWGSGGYWPNYWGGYWGGGYYYPYSITYSLTTNSFITEIVDLQDKTDDKLTVLWMNYLVGPTYSTSTTTSLVIKGVQQAFSQSPYLKK